QHPEALIVDLSHEVSPFNNAEASYIVGAAYNRFPKGSVHLIGVDASRTPKINHVAVLWNGHYFIAANNGILSMLMRKMMPEKMVEITIHDRLPSEATDMDIFATVAVHLVKGGNLSVIGKEITALHEITELQPVISPETNSIKGYVMYIDHFGNAVTNIDQQLFIEMAKGRPYELTIKRDRLKTIYANYAAIEQVDSKSDHTGKTIAIFNEAGFLEIGIYKSGPHTGTATTLLGLRYRDFILIEFKS
ncbi:MAG: SAM hydrolase/SAM-dependent halogenase family protein, partial [Crocinitomicaceae bacterium]